MKKSLTIISVLVAVYTVTAQQSVLTKEQIAAAIDYGVHGKDRYRIGLHLSEGWAAETESNCLVYTPTTWIRKLSAEAASEFRELKPEDLKDEDLAPVLRVYATPLRIGTSKVLSVVIRDLSQRIVLQPIETKEFDVPSKKEKEQLTGMLAIFPLDKVSDIRKESKDGGFYITVVSGVTTVYGEVNRIPKDLEIKKKYFDDLP